VVEKRLETTVLEIFDMRSNM